MYYITNDTASLKTAWEMIKERDINLPDAQLAALEMAQYYMNAGNMDEAGTLCKSAVECFGPSSPLPLKSKGYHLFAMISGKCGEYKTAIDYYEKYYQVQEQLLKSHYVLEVSNMESRSEIARAEFDLENRHKTERMLTTLLIIGLIILSLEGGYRLVMRLYASKHIIGRYHKDLEEKQRSLVSSALVMEEKDNVLKSVLTDIHKMESEGKINADETQRLEQNVKIHLGGRQDWEDFRLVFDNVHPNFHKYLKENYPNLTEGDLRLATYIKAGMQGKQIARMLMLQPDTIRKNRQKLRRRLGLSTDDSLEDFIRNVDN